MKPSALRLKGPRESNRTRLQQLVASRRALTPLDDIGRYQASHYWTSLPLGAKCAALRFTDLSLVHCIHNRMDRLARAELCAEAIGFRYVIGGSTGRLSGFGFEVGDTTDDLGLPDAFVACENFASNDLLLRDLQQKLGSPLLDGRSVLQRQDWLMLFHRTAASWEELQVQVFKLVELAILHAFLDAGSPQELCSAAYAIDTAPVKQSVGSKRRARQKKKQTSETPAGETAISKMGLQGHGAVGNDVDEAEVPPELSTETILPERPSLQSQSQDVCVEFTSSCERMISPSGESASLQTASGFAPTKDTDLDQPCHVPEPQERSIRCCALTLGELGKDIDTPLNDLLLKIGPPPGLSLPADADNAVCTLPTKGLTTSSSAAKETDPSDASLSSQVTQEHKKSMAVTSLCPEAGMLPESPGQYKIKCIWQPECFVPTALQVCHSSTQHAWGAPNMQSTFFVDDVEQDKDVQLEGVRLSWDHSHQKLEFEQMYIFAEACGA